MKIQLLGEGCEPLQQLIDLHSVLKIENAPSSDAEYLTVKNERLVFCCGHLFTRFTADHG